MKIPSNKLWTQLNEGEVTGILNDTRNIALDTVGQARLSRKAVAIMSSDSNANFGYVVAIVYFGGNYTVVTSDKIFQGELDGNTFSEVTAYTPSVQTYSDAIVFNSRLVVTTATQITDWDGATDDNYTLGALTTGVPHPMAIFDSNPTYKLAIGNGNTVKTYDTSYNANATILALPTQFIVTSLRYRNGYLYVGTKTTDGSEARIFIWNGSGTNAQYECPVGAEWVFSMTEYGSSVAAITNAGQLIQVSGSQYVQLAALPIYYAPHASWERAATNSSFGKVFNRGMATIGQNIYLNIEGGVYTGFVPEMKSGVWVFDPEVGLYHKSSYSTDVLVEDDTLSVTNSIITTAANHNLLTGDGVQFRTTTGLTGLSNDYVYYVTVIAANQIKLSLSREGVVNENYVTIYGTAGALDVLVYYPNTHYGDIIGSTSSGAIAQSTIKETPIGLLVSEVIWGTRAQDETFNNVYSLNAFSDQNNIGYLTTQRIYTDNIEQTWREVYTFIDGITTSNDEVVVKVQTKAQPQRIELEGIWTSSNTINTFETREFTAWRDIKDGDEIIFTQGEGQGRTAHVVGTPEFSTTVATITIDEDYGTAENRVYLYRTNFKKIGVFNATNKDNEFFKAPLLDIGSSPWIKVKCELRGAGTVVNMLELSNVIHKNT
jgi:hypothetical protein